MSSTGSPVAHEKDPDANPAGAPPSATPLGSTGVHDATATEAAVRERLRRGWAGANLVVPRDVGTSGAPRGLPRVTASGSTARSPTQSPVARKNDSETASAARPSPTPPAPTSAQFTSLMAGKGAGPTRPQRHSKARPDWRSFH
jgi:hypothetical protein